MQKNSHEKIEVSIIIVHYKVSERLFECLRSIRLSKPDASYEVIVVDNDDVNYLGEKIKKKFGWVKYIKSKSNIGFASGNNLGARYAKGKFIFFLNPDSIVLNNTVENLVSFLKAHEKAVVAPLLLDPNKKVYPLQGTAELTPLRGIIGLSFINRLFPKNFISKEYWLIGWNKSKVQEVDVVPGTAFALRRSTYEQINGFDEEFFLYFEEFDLCNRLKQIGLKLYIIPSAKLIHYWGESTRQKVDKDEIFKKSRFLYFKKHYGVGWALFVHVLTSIGKNSIFLFLILAAALYLRVAMLDQNMMFIGDFGWFYLSARDMLLNGDIPLVGITSSRTWLHQGPLWTYMLAGVFAVFGFNPVNGGYLSAVIGVLTVGILYFVISKVFTKRIGIITTILYAFSPLAVFHARMPYHITPIPVFTILLFYCLYKWIKGKVNFFPLSIFMLCILYQLELASVIYVFMFVFIILFGFWKKPEFFRNVFDIKILTLSVIAFVLPMLPILIYDFYHNFSQTIIFVLWVPYKFLKFIFNSFMGSGSLYGFSSFFYFYLQLYKNLIFNPSFSIALILLVTSIYSFVVDMVRQVRSSNIKVGYMLLAVFLFSSSIGIFISQTPSEAYAPLTFVNLIIILSLVFDKLLKVRKLFFVCMVLFSLLIFGNVYYLVSNNFTNPGITLSQRVEASKKIIKMSEGFQYALVGQGPGSEHRSFTMNYEYLTWWLGKESVENSTSRKIVISESASGITLHVENN